MFFYQFRGVKLNFTTFGPKSLGKSPTGPPLEKILPTPMSASGQFAPLPVEGGCETC